MIFVNGKAVVDYDPKTDVSVDYSAIRADLEKKYRFPIVLRQKKERQLFENGVLAKIPNMSLPLQCNYTPANSYLSYQYRYCKNTADINNQMATSRMLMKETMVITESNKDLALFLMYILKDDDGTSFFDRYYEVFSTKALNSKIADVRKKEADLNFYIYSERSPLSEDIDRLISIGKSLGMPNLKYDKISMNKDTIRNAVFDYVMEGEELGDDRRNIEMFISSISAYVDVSYKAFVQDLFDEAILELDLDDNSVYLKETKEFIVRVSDYDIDNYVSIVANYLKSDQTKRNKVEEIANRKALPDANYSYEDIAGASQKVLRLISRELKIKIKPHASEDEMRTEVLSVLGLKKE